MSIYPRISYIHFFSSVVYLLVTREDICVLPVTRMVQLKQDLKLLLQVLIYFIIDIIFINKTQLFSGLGSRALAAYKPRIETSLCAKNKILRIWVVCLRKCLDLQLRLWRFYWGLHAAYARLPSQDYFVLKSAEIIRFEYEKNIFYWNINANANIMFIV